MKRRWITLVVLGSLVLGARGATAAAPHAVDPPATPAVVDYDHYGASGMIDGYGGDPKGPLNVRWGYYPGVYGYGRWGTYYRPWRGNYRSQGTSNYKPPYYGWHGPSAQHLNDRLGPRIN